MNTFLGDYSILILCILKLFTIWSFNIHEKVIFRKTLTLGDHIGWFLPAVPDNSIIFPANKLPSL